MEQEADFYAKSVGSLDSMKLYVHTPRTGLHMHGEMLRQIESL
jgi:hypothetical protein